MKHNIQSLVVVLVLVYLGATPLAYAETSFFTGLRYDRFDDDRSPEANGSDLTVPIGITYQGKQLFLSLEMGYSNADVDPGGNSDSSISSLTDTLVSLSYNRPDLPLGILLGIDLNLPTGDESLRVDQRAAEFGENHDFFEVDNFGDGFNVGLSVEVVKEFGRVNLGLTGSYIFRREFDPTEDIANDDLDPGDTGLFIALLNWKVSPRFNLDTLLGYAHFTPDKLNGQDNFQEGARFAIGGNLNFDFKPFGLIINLQDVIQGKNEELVAGELQEETENGNGNNFFGLVDFTYEYSKAFTLEFIADLRYYGEGNRKMNGIPVEGRRVRYAFGPGLFYTFSKKISFSGLMKYFILEENRDRFLNQDVTFRGFNLDFGITYTF